MNQDNSDSLTYKAMPLAGKVICDSKKADVSASKKPAVVLPKTLKRLQAGHRCKSTQSLITKKLIKDMDAEILKASPALTETQKKAIRLETEYQWALLPKDCAARAKVLQAAGSCNFF
jgi:predicted metal-dependent HD superfamily phosphohydrolase